MPDTNPDTNRYRCLFLGAIGVLAETSDLQRDAFNLAFRQTGLDWEWDAARYRDLLHEPGGAARIATEAKRLGVQVDAKEVHARKVANFRAAVLRQGLTPRPGVIETMRAAREAGMTVAWVTTTGPQTVELMLDGFAGKIGARDFDFITDRSDVARPKPASDIYVHALACAGVPAKAALAVEDTPESAMAAHGAGIATIGVPGWAATSRRFPDGVQTAARLSPDLLSEPQTA